MTPRRGLAIGLLLVAVVAAWALWGRGDGGDALAAAGTVEATEAQLGFPVPGRLEAVLAQEGDAVSSGRELARLERAEWEARVRQARAQVAAARAALRELTAGFRREEVAQARSALEAAERRLVDAQQSHERTRVLREGGAVSQEAFDRSATALEVAQAQRDQAAEQLALLEAGPRGERIEAQRAQLAQAEAGASALEATLDQLTIRAPFDGVVTLRHREPGEIVPAGSPVVTVVNLDDRWVRIYVPETRVSGVALGQAAEVTADGDPGGPHAGVVSFIASEAEFTPRNVQTQEERVKLVYAVKVRITGDSGRRLKPGLPVDVRLLP